MNSLYYICMAENLEWKRDFVGDHERLTLRVPKRYTGWIAQEDRTPPFKLEICTSSTHKAKDLSGEVRSLNNLAAEIRARTDKAYGVICGIEGQIQGFALVQLPYDLRSGVVYINGRKREYFYE